MADKRIEKLLEKAKKLVGVDDEDIKVVLVPMKTKIATTSLRNKTIRLSRDYIKYLDDDEILYLLVHELVHHKIRSVHHDDRFQREIERVYPGNAVWDMRNRILKKMINAYAQQMN